MSDRSRGRLAAARRFFRTPKGVLTLILLALVALTTPSEGLAQIWPGVTAAAVVAMALDAPILRFKYHSWTFPSGALLTGLIVAMVLSPQEPWHVTALTAALAIISKYVFRARRANAFNPAALALVATFYLFNTGHSWWGALPGLGYPGVVVLLGTGLYITDRVNKMPLVLAFLGGYFLLFTIAAWTGDPAHVVEIYRTPDAQAALYLAFFILTDPPTAPAKYSHQVVCGTLVAVVSVAVFELTGAAYYLLAGVLVGNVWEAWRRVRSHAAS
jgi:Na+-translocating ferredoxin:NAD+ oxidoreductase RnfD subunit